MASESGSALLNLTDYNSTDSLSYRFYDYSNVFLLPAICLFGIFTNVLNIVVLARSRITENIYLYMLIAAVADLIFLVIQAFIALIRCGTLCPYGYTYSAKVYELYVYLYVGYTIVTFSALVDISISIDRILLFSSRGRIVSRNRFAVRCALLFAASALLVLPGYALAKEIVPAGALVHWKSAGNETTFTREILYTKSVRSDWLQPALQVPVLILSIAKGPALILLVLVVDVVVIFKFRGHLEKKRKITLSTLNSKQSRESREANRATFMIISVSLLYFVGNLMDSMVALIELFGVDVYATMPMYVIIGNVLFFGSHGLNVFIYYKFDRKYRNIFNQVFMFGRVTRGKNKSSINTQATKIE